MNNIFRNILKGKTVIVGLGNTLKGDDGAGPSVIEKIQGKVKALCIDAGTAPENYLGKIIKENPDTVLFVDAADINRLPGEYALLEKQEILKTGFTTHDLSPAVLIEYLSKETKADMYLLGIQPLRINFDENMSDEIKKTIIEIVGLVEESQNA
ncbi:MAG: hydrogenase 3 maturation endopeptidase HyCI [Candidatus Omnitrophica bacterium]|nr:hydrogenase 3 maturation endopeptidase HyCI [Candidatus Omnitrophota bacterium]